MRAHSDSASRHLLDLCRRAMPHVAGVVLATLTGRVVAHEETLVPDAPHVAARAAKERAAGTSALIAHKGGLYLVVFVPTPASLLA